jgi:RNA polymerase sigma factor (sigma-70 family)
MENELNKKLPLDEKEQLRLAKAGGEEGKKALGELYNLYDDYVHDQAGRCLYEQEDLDDFCQEVWKRTIQQLPKYQGETLRGLLGKAYFGVGQPEGIIGHYYLKFIRDKSEILHYYSKTVDKPPARGEKAKIFSLQTRVGTDDHEVPIYLNDIIPDDTKSPLEIAIENETRDIVKSTIEKLPKGYRYVILMRYFDNRPVGEIATLLNIKEEQVYLRLSRANKMLKGLLEKKLGKDPLEEINIYSAKKMKRKI